MLILAIVAFSFFFSPTGPGNPDSNFLTAVLGGQITNKTKVEWITEIKGRFSSRFTNNAYRMQTFFDLTNDSLCNLLERCDNQRDESEQVKKIALFRESIGLRWDRDEYLKYLDEQTKQSQNTFAILKMLLYILLKIKQRNVNDEMGVFGGFQNNGIGDKMRNIFGASIGLPEAIEMLHEMCFYLINANEISQYSKLMPKVVDINNLLENKPRRLADSEKVNKIKQLAGLAIRAVNGLKGCITVDAMVLDKSKREEIDEKIGVITTEMANSRDLASLARILKAFVEQDWPQVLFKAKKVSVLEDAMSRIPNGVWAK